MYFDLPAIDGDFDPPDAPQDIADYYQGGIDLESLDNMLLVLAFVVVVIFFAYSAFLLARDKIKTARIKRQRKEGRA